MSTTIDVLSPADQEGTRATILRWLRKPGDAVTANEPLLELETDKVTVEVPAPASGRLAEILKQEKEEVEPGAVLARVSTVATVSAPASQAPASPPVPRTAATRENSSSAPAAGLLSPAVKRLLAENSVDPANIPATGKGGRLTAQDITLYMQANKQSPPPQARGEEKAGASRRVPHSAIRRRIAAHMVESIATAPHVTTLFEVDMSRVMAHRARHVKDFDSRGVKLTYTAYFVAAAAKALQAVPEVNSRFHEDALELFSDCNIGVGTALGNEGLIVPVVHRAQTLDLFGIAGKLGELVNSARAGKLAPEAVRGGTFTISNHGVSGSLLAAPIVINQPQVAIMGVGKLERRVVVDEVDGQDAIRVKPMCYLTLTLDHRALDAFQANAFLTRVAGVVQNWPG
jgi:2-oxoglutarate dehydrogenase E2 component (dihydrolipoamide succinyltransferase)